MKKKSNSYKRFYPTLKWIISILSIVFFIFHWRALDGDLFSSIINVFRSNYLIVSLILTLAIVNWNGEAYKLRLLLASEIKLSQLRAFLVVLGGMAISNFTPARTGEYIGRGLLLKKVHPVKVIIATVTGNLAQVLFTYGIGLAAVLFFMLGTEEGTNLIGKDSNIWIGIITFCTIIVFIVFGKKILSRVKSYLPKKLRKIFNIVKKYNGPLFAKVTTAAGIRYLAFSIQFYLLLQLFSDFSIPMESGVLVPVAYLLQTLVPVPAVSDVGVRVAVSQLLFGNFISDSSILMAVTCLWFINLILPGLFGTLYLIYSTILKK